MPSLVLVVNGVLITFNFKVFDIFSGKGRFGLHQSIVELCAILHFNCLNMTFENSEVSRMSLDYLLEADIRVDFLTDNFIMDPSFLSCRIVGRCFCNPGIC